MGLSMKRNAFSLRHLSAQHLKIRSRMSIPATLNFNALILPIGSLVPLVIALSRYTDNRHHPTVRIEI